MLTRTKRDTLPPEVVNAKEQELAGLRLEAKVRAERQRRRQEKQKINSSRYKMVKFFEKKKVLKKMGQTVRRIQELESAEKEDNTEVAKKREILEQELKDLKGDLLYIKHFPTTKKYISIFGQEEKSVKHRERIKKHILVKFSEKEEKKKLNELSQETYNSLTNIAMQQAKKGKAGERKKENDDREEEQEQEEEVTAKIKAEDTEEDSQSTQDDLDGDDFFLPKAEKLDDL